jgi:hypothetical protein
MSEAVATLTPAPAAPETPVAALPPAASGSSAGATPDPAPADPFAPDQFTDSPSPPKASPTDGDDPAEPEGDKPAEGAPEVYADFAVPEGMTLDPVLLTEATDLARTLNLPQDKAQALIDLGIKQAQSFAEAQAREVETIQAEWMKQTKADPEIGGDKLVEALGAAQRGLKAYGTPALNDLLTAFGLAKHPEVIRVFAAIGKTVSEDRFVPADTGAQAPASLAERLYPQKKGT